MSMRIYVVGGPGSGKTRLATALSRDCGAPLLELDGLYARLFEHDAEGGIAAAAHHLRERLVAEYVSRDAWVIEGSMPGFLDAFAQASDLVVWCDVPFLVAATRMVRRHVLADLRGNNRYPGYWRLVRFLRDVRGYHAARPRPDDPWGSWTRAGVAQAACRYGPKLVRVSGGSFAHDLLAVLERVNALAYPSAGGGAAPPAG